MILPLEQQVTSLELSRRLVEAGVPGETHFIWRDWRRGGGVHVHERSPGGQHAGALPMALAPAWTAAELMEVLGPSQSMVDVVLRERYAASCDDSERGYTADGPTAAEALGLLVEKVWKEKQA